MHDQSLVNIFRSALENQGYSFTVRVEIEVRKGDEHWKADAEDQDAAVTAIMHSMLPSQLAREAFIRAFRNSVECPELPEKLAVQEDPVPERTDDPPQALLPVAAASSATDEQVNAEQSPVASFAPVQSPAVQPNSPHLEELNESLTELIETMNAHVDELPRWSTLRQRLKITEWVSAARSLEEQSGFDQGIVDRVHQMVRLLSRLARISWPGSIEALKVQCDPADAAITIEGFKKSAPESWKACEMHCHEQLETLNARASRTKEDEEGWFDSAQLNPQPVDAAARLALIASELERISGPLAPVGKLNGHLVEIPDIRIMDPARLESTRKEWVLWVRTVRWLRGSELDAWGLVIGRLRWLAFTTKETAVAEGLLAAAACPDISWARANGYDPKKQQNKKERKRLLSSLKSVPAGEPLLIWLKSALMLGEELNNQRLLPHILERKEDFLALGPNPKGLDQRSTRTRWKKLHAMLTQPAVQQSALPDSSEESTCEDIQVETDSAHPLEAQVRDLIRGKRILVVSNRNDDVRDRELAERLDVSGTLKAIVYSERKGEAAAQSIANGSYEIVLALTGFLSHAADRKLKQAALKAQVTYVRANRGRPAACISALARDLGLRN